AAVAAARLPDLTGNVAADRSGGRRRDLRPLVGSAAARRAGPAARRAEHGVAWPRAPRRAGRAAGDPSGPARDAGAAVRVARGAGGVRLVAAGGARRAPGAPAGADVAGAARGRGRRGAP